MKGYTGKDYQRNDYDNKMSTAYAKGGKREVGDESATGTQVYTRNHHRSTDYSCYRPSLGYTVEVRCLTLST